MPAITSNGTKSPTNRSKIHPNTSRDAAVAAAAINRNRRPRNSMLRPGRNVVTTPHRPEMNRSGIDSGTLAVGDPSKRPPVGVGGRKT